MSRLNPEALKTAITAVIAGSTENKRKFVETIELQIGLKDYDTTRDKRFAGTVKLPHIPRPRMKVCVIGDEQHCEEAQKANIEYIDLEALKKYKGNKKAIKKLAGKYDAFLASQPLIPQIPRLLGPGLNKAGKFPTVLTHSEKLIDRVNEQKQSIKFQLKKVLCMGVGVANVDMSEEAIRQNIVLAINFLVSLLKKNWNNVKSLVIKSSMGKPQRIFG
eukprot:GHVR01114232.1.p1 GENE.GHVR01114232.1~~GHVR01114232.1.p1  ORF type:complete len:218 (+),score=24.75 GHVR01114232.1:25-678(+)